MVQLEERCATRNWHSFWDGQPLCNGAAQVETRAKKVTGDTGFCHRAKRWPHRLADRPSGSAPVTLPGARGARKGSGLAL
jgi:hypothetical protein